MRIYNPSLGKFLSVDPLKSEYPWNSTYAFAENDVIRCIDLDGAEKEIKLFSWSKKTSNYVRWMASDVVLETAKVLVRSSGLPQDGIIQLWERPEKGSGKFDPYTCDATYAYVVNGKAYSVTFTADELNVAEVQARSRIAQRKILINAIMDGIALTGEAFTMTIPEMLPGEGGGKSSKAPNFNKTENLVTKVTTQTERAAAQAEEFIGDGIRMSERSLKDDLSSFDNLDDLAHFFDGKDLAGMSGDLQKAGWSEVKGKWGSKTVYEKIIRNERYYAMWEPSNMNHSTNGSPTSYWKLTKGKISAYGDNVKRVSNATNFQQ